MSERIIGSTQATVQFDLIDTDDLINTGRGVADVTDFFTRVGLPVLKGNPGPQGVPGQSLVVLGTKGSTSELPALSNTIGDQGKAYWIGSILYAWSGTAWIPSPDLQGPEGNPSLARVTERNNYVSGITYTYGDVVTYGTQRWLLQTPHTGPATFDPTKWVPLGLSRHFIQVRRSGTQSVNTDLWSACVWNSSAGDVSLFNVSGSTVTPLVAGWYSVEAFIAFAVGGNNVRASGVWKNGGAEHFAGPAMAGYPGNVNYPASGLEAGSPSGVVKVYCNGTTDYIQGMGWQNSGGPLNMDAGAHSSLRMALEYIHP